MPDLAGAQGLPTEWVSMDIDEVAPGFDSLVALSQGQNDPTSSFAYLEGITDAEVVGTETVAGFETTHYRGSADMQEALDRLSAEADADARQALAQARKIMGTTDVPIDVWIDEDGLVRRMSFSMEASAGAAGSVLHADEHGDLGVRHRRRTADPTCRRSHGPGAGHGRRGLLIESVRGA